MVWPKVACISGVQCVPWRLFPRPGAMGAVKSTFAQCKLPSIHRRRLRLR